MFAAIINCNNRNCIVFHDKSCPEHEGTPHEVIQKLSKLQLRFNFFELDEYWTSSGYGYVQRPDA